MAEQELLREQIQVAITLVLLVDQTPEVEVEVEQDRQALMLLQVVVLELLVDMGFNLTQCLEIQQHFGQILGLMVAGLHQLLVDIGLLEVEAEAYTLLGRVGMAVLVVVEEEHRMLRMAIHCQQILLANNLLAAAVGDLAVLAAMALSAATVVPVS